MSFLLFESPATWPVLAIAQTLKEVADWLGVTVNLSDAVLPGDKGLAKDTPSAVALQSIFVVEVLVQPVGTLETVRLAPLCAMSSTLGLVSEEGPRLVTLAATVVELPAWTKSVVKAIWEVKSIPVAPYESVTTCDCAD